MNRKTVLIPFLLVGHFAGAGQSVPADSARIVVLSDRVGPVVSPDERQRYHLFTQFKDFSRAVVLQLPDSSCAVRFTLVSTGGLRDTLVRYSWTAIMLMADRIEHFEELEKGEAEPGAPCVALYSPVDNMVLPNHALQATGAGWIHQETSPISHVAMLYHRQTAELVVEYLKSMANAKN